MGRNLVRGSKRVMFCMSMDVKLREQMKRIDETHYGVNWSYIARRAFRKYIERLDSKEHIVKHRRRA